MVLKNALLRLPARHHVWLACALALAAPACIKRGDTQPMVTEPLPVQVAWVVDVERDTPPKDAPASLIKAGDTELSRRNLVAVPHAAETWSNNFGLRRATSHRMAWLDARTEAHQGLLLLVELRPYYDNPSQGRYRWIVSVRITAAPAANPARIVDESFEVPVFLQFTGLGEDDALAQAEGEIRRRLGRVLDVVLQDPEATWRLQGDIPADAGAGAGSSYRLPGTPAAVAPLPSTRGQLPPDPRDHDAIEGPIAFVMVDRFANGDPSNDPEGTDPTDPQAPHGGDLAGLRARLDHLDRLGVRTVWLSPLATTQWSKAGETGGFHGYWTLDPHTIDPAWGTWDDLRALRDDLHGRGMSLMLDVVTNHLGYATTLRDDKPTWFHHNGPVQDWSDPVQSETFDVHGLPDLAVENPEVRRWLVDAARTWIDRVQPDGFRLDAVRHVPLSFWADYNAAVGSHGGEGFALLGELFDGSPVAVASTWSAGGFRQMFDFPLHYALVEGACGDAGLSGVGAVLSLDRVYDDPTQLVTFLDNHDLPRILSTCGGSEDAVTNALALMLGLRGVPAVTWGTEAGLSGASEPANRADMVFDRITPVGEALSRLVGVRRGHSALTSPHTRVLRASDEQLALLRWSDDEAVVVAWTRADAPMRLKLPPELPVIGANDLVEGRPVDVTVTDGGARVLVRPGAVRWLHLEVDRDALAAWAAADPGSVTVAFEASAPDGDDVRVVGGAPELGAWNPAAGLRLQRERGRHVGTVQVPAHSVLAYKLVRVGESGVQWDDGANRVVHAVSDQAVVLSWGDSE